MTKLAPALCSNCQATLEPGWKFCINCGTPVPRVRPLPALKETAFGDTAQGETVQRESAKPQIPAAIRPTTDAPPTHRKVNVSLVVSIVLGAAGAALIVYLVIVVFGSHG